MNQFIRQLKYRVAAFIKIATYLLVIQIACAPTLASSPDKNGLSPGCYDRFAQDWKLGLKYTQSQDYKAALPHWQNIVKADPNDIQGLQYLSEALEKVGDLKGALAVSDRILQLNPADGGTLLRRIGIFEQMHQHAKALEESRLMTKVGCTGEALATLGSFHGAGNSEATLARLRQQLTRTPNNPDLYYSMCEIYSDLGRQSEAAEAAARCSHFSPKYSWVWRTAKVKEAGADLAMSQETAAMKLLDESLANLEFGKRNRPDTASLVLERALTTKAQVYETQKKYKAALAALTTLIDNHFPNPDFFLRRAAMYLKLQDSAHALADLGMAIYVAPSQNAPLVKRSALLTSLGRYKDAIEDVNKLIKMSPPDDTFFLQRAKLYALDGDCKRAIEDYTRAIKLEPDEDILYKGRAAMYRKLGENKEADADETIAKKLAHRHVY